MNQDAAGRFQPLGNVNKAGEKIAPDPTLSPIETMPRRFGELGSSPP